MQSMLFLVWLLCILSSAQNDDAPESNYGIMTYVTDMDNMAYDHYDTLVYDYVEDDEVSDDEDECSQFIFKWINVGEQKVLQRTLEHCLQNPHGFSHFQYHNGIDTPIPPLEVVKGHARTSFQGWAKFIAFIRAWSATDFSYLLEQSRIPAHMLPEYLGEDVIGNARWRKSTGQVSGSSERVPICVYQAKEENPSCSKPEDATPYGCKVPKEESCTVRYLSEVTRKRKLCLIEKGKFYRQPALVGRHRNRVGSTPKLVPLSSMLAMKNEMRRALRPGDDRRQSRPFVQFDTNQFEGDFLYVIDLDKKVYVTPFSWIGGLHHSSLSAGQPVICSGTMKFATDGTLVEVSNDSGHYRPNAMRLYEALEVLLSHGVPLTESVTIRLIVGSAEAERINTARSFLTGVDRDLVGNAALSRDVVQGQGNREARKKKVQLEPVSAPKSGTPPLPNLPRASPRIGRKGLKKAGFVKTENQ